MFSEDRVVAKDFHIDNQSRLRVEEPNRIHEAGITDDVLAFAGNSAHHPETWLDFPVQEGDDLDDSQKEHVAAIECLIPRLRALRIELCPAHMSDGYFWRVYVVLLHSRLDKHVAELLSTPQVIEARAKWMHELQKQAKEELDQQCYHEKDAFWHDDLSSPSMHIPNADNQALEAFSSEPATSTRACDSEIEKRPVESTGMGFIDKLVIKEKPVIKTVEDKSMLGAPSPKLHVHTFDDDDWLDEDLLENGNAVVAIPPGIEEKVSFSDLEDDDCSLHIKYDISSKH